MSTNHEPPAGPEHGGDPSMEDILASIRRILNEEEPHAPSPKDVLELTPAMRADPELPLAAPPPTPHEEPVPPRVEAPPPVVETPLPQAAPPPAAEAAPEPPPQPEAKPEAAPKAKPEARTEAEVAALVAPAAAAAAAASMGELVRRLANSQNVAVHRGGPTLEDMVREEIRGLLKAWLDENLPRIVERLVRAEIERVVGRHVG